MLNHATKPILDQMKEFVKEHAIKEFDFDESWPVLGSIGGSL